MTLHLVKTGRFAPDPMRCLGIGLTCGISNHPAYGEAIESIPALLKQDIEVSKEVAKTKYSLEFGVASYFKIYNQLKQNSQL